MSGPGDTRDAIVVAPARQAAEAAAIDRAHNKDAARAGYLAELAARDGLFIARRDGRPVGFACLDLQFFFRQAFVSLVVVHPEARRRGIGRALLAELEARAGRPRLFTSTNLSNAPMVALLRRRSYTLCGQVIGLEDDDPEILFMKDL